MTQAIKKSDAQIHHDVLEELKWDSRVDETEVGLQVAGGVVTLTGTVTSWAKRVAAQEAARRVIGVLDVANDLKVKVPGGLARTDTEIAQAGTGHWRHSCVCGMRTSATGKQYHYRSEIGTQRPRHPSALPSLLSPAIDSASAAGRRDRP